MASATYNLAKEARDAAKAAQADAKSRYGAGSAQHLAAIADVQNAAKTMHAEKAAEGKSHAEAKEERDALVASTAGKSGKELFDIQTKIRAYGNVMREETGRQKGERTSYIGPGMRVRIDDEGRTVTQDGRVQYEVDPNAYARRFIPQYTPTQEQIDRGLTGGLLTPWQQTNIQNMLQYPGLLDQEDISGLTIEEQRNLGLFGEGIKEGRVPAAWRDAWRTQEWGDVKDPTTGLWTQADDARRAEAVADQLERYNMGAFNPTTGKLTLDDQGNIVGPRASWGPETGILDPDDVYIDNPPVGGPGVGGPGVGGPPNPTVPSFGYSQYKDWTRFMPTNFQLAEGGGMHYQPWATGLPVGGGSGPILTPPGGGGGTITGPGVINPNIWGTDTTTTNTNTGVIPGSDKANDLAAGRIHHTEMYDANDMWVGAEGGGAVEAGLSANVNQGGNTGFMNTWDNPNTGTQPFTGYPNQIGITPNTAIPSNALGHNVGTVYDSGIQNVSNNIGLIPTSEWNELVNTTHMEQYTDQPSGVLGDYSLTPKQWAGVASASKPTLDLIGLLEAEAGSQDGVSLDADFDAGMGFYE